VNRFALVGGSGVRSVLNWNLLRLKVQHLAVLRPLFPLARIYCLRKGSEELVRNVSVLLQSRYHVADETVGTIG
jgi:hypothetical protein